VTSSVRLCHLYPGEMNIYADRGNIAVLSQRLAWRGLTLEVTELGLGDPLAAGAFDLVYLGGGQDRDQAVVAEDLVATKAEGLEAAVAGGAAMLAVCGGFQLAGRGYTALDGSRMPGLGLLDADTHAGTTRLIGNLVIEADLDGERRTLVGFENHAGRTRLGPAARPLGQVVRGHGNNGDDGGEGAVQRRVIGTYLHGPLLPKNPWLADRVLGWALEHRTGRVVALDPLDDDLEAAAHAVAVLRA
jgi:CobQ-like glutamine amidotransferase family enzyme